MGLHVIVKGLMGAGVQMIFLTGYRIKIPIGEQQHLNTSQTTPLPFIGMNMDTDYILFLKTLHT